jgi:type II secretion system protein G
MSAMHTHISRFIQSNRGFTIVELLIVIVVIGILAAIVIVAFNGVQNRAKDTRTRSDIKNVQSIVEKYNAETGRYPSTGDLATVRTDANCYGGTAQSDWVPSVTEKLPQSVPNTGKGRGGTTTGCYMYSSNGDQYIISAWNMSNSGPQNNGMYRRLGYREMSFISANAYLCNHLTIGGGATGGGYNATNG